VLNPISTEAIAIAGLLLMVNDYTLGGKLLFHGLLCIFLMILIFHAYGLADLLSRDTLMMKISCMEKVYIKYY
jgi:hypothetical protein